MSVTDTTAPGQTNALRFEIALSHPPAKVWRALTEPELLARWLLPAFDLKLEPGAPFLLKTQPYPGWDGTVNCRFQEIEPLRKLSYTWTVPMLDTVVTFTLTPTPTGTLLCVEQAGFREDQKQNFHGARYGWKSMGAKLVELLE